MGNRLHVAKLYKVEYGMREEFNRKSEEFHDLIRKMGIQICGSDEYIPLDFEIDKENWHKAIDNLKNNLYEIDRELKNLDCTKDEMIEIMEYYERESDPDDNYLHFSFF